MPHSFGAENEEDACRRRSRPRSSAASQRSLPRRKSVFGFGRQQASVICQHFANALPLKHSILVQKTPSEPSESSQGTAASKRNNRMRPAPAPRCLEGVIQVSRLCQAWCPRRLERARTMGIGRFQVETDP